MREGIVASKKEEGKWAIRAFPQFELVISRCLDDYASGEPTNGKPDNEELCRFAYDMLGQISKH